MLSMAKPVWRCPDKSEDKSRAVGVLVISNQLSWPQWQHNFTINHGKGRGNYRNINEVSCEIIFFYSLGNYYY